MSKIENNRIYYDPYNEIRCDKFALEKFVKESEEKDKTIADLEAKLAESEKNVEFYQERYSNATTSAYGADLISKNIQSRLEEEIRELKQQLAEKEQEYKELKNKLHIAEQETLHFQNKYFAEKQIAIEELEKVKETTECVLDNALKNCSLNQSYYDRLLDEIDNQIKQLRGE